jgi:hypothetical protein
MKVQIAFALLLGMLMGCATVPGSRVVERADDLGSAPSWASITRPTFEENGKRFFLGWIEVDGDASKSAALNMADEKAMSEPMRGLADEFLDQNQVGEELRKDASVGQRIISATRGYRPPMPSLHISKRYWETVLTLDNRLELRAFSLVEIPVQDFEKAKRDYSQKLAGNSEVKTILKDVGAKQRERVLTSEE